MTEAKKLALDARKALSDIFLTICTTINFSTGAESDQGRITLDQYNTLRMLLDKLDEIAGLEAVQAPMDDDRVLKEACKPWELATGEPPEYESPLFGVFLAGMFYAERLLAALLDVKRYEGGDGNEDFDEDATLTLRNILQEAGIYDLETGLFATHAEQSPAPLPEIPGLDFALKTLAEGNNGLFNAMWSQCVAEFSADPHEICEEAARAYNELRKKEK
jgi:hypothetical protein